jgi:hypothetical protein
VTDRDGAPWLDDDAGRLVRPYVISNGRTEPTRRLDLLSVVRATGVAGPSALDVEHARALDLCHAPASVAEIAARLGLPLSVTKILICDLIDSGAAATTRRDDLADHVLLQEVLDGLRRRL